MAVEIISVKHKIIQCNIIMVNEYQQIMGFKEVEKKVPLIILADEICYYHPSDMTGESFDNTHLEFKSGKSIAVLESFDQFNEAYLKLYGESN